MTLFCSNCGKQMNDDARFCMGCGANLGNYTQNGADINNNVIQRSQVGAASVGNINISPSFSTGKQAQKDLCPKCGFQMENISSSVEGSTILKGVTIKYQIIFFHDSRLKNTAFVCQKCNYKSISSNFRIFAREFKKCLCGGDLVKKVEGIFQKTTYEKCLECGTKKEHYQWCSDWEYEIYYSNRREILQSHGWELLG